MGYNTTVVVMNDALGTIKDDPEFGKNLHDAISRIAMDRGKTIDVPAYTYREDGSICGTHCNAATVIETHHADGTAVVAVGGNMGVELTKYCIYPYGEEDYRLRVLKALADDLGYYVARKPKR